MRVKCPKCKRSNVYVTTDEYNPDITPHGGMVKLRNPKHKGGMTFGVIKKGHVKAALMECCDCGGLLTKGGRLIVLPEEIKPIRQLTQAEINQIVIDAEFNDDPVFTVSRDDVIVRIEVSAPEDWKPGRMLTPEEEKHIKWGATEESCPKCGRLESEFKNRSGFVNHCRKCNVVKDSHETT